MKRLSVLLALALAGCGGPAADLFLVERSGADPGANLTLLASQDGTVTCNGIKHDVAGDVLLKARALERALSPQAELHLALPPGPNSVLSYRARMEAGTVAFSDTSRPLPPTFSELMAFTQEVAEDVCGIDRG